MGNWFQKNKGLTLDEPAVTLTKHYDSCVRTLQEAGVSCEADEEGLLTFVGRAFGADFPMVMKLHREGKRLAFVEMFRTVPMDARDSYKQMSEILKNRLGKTLLASAAITKKLPSEQWYRRGITVSHFLMERGELEEFLYVLFR